MSSWKEILKKDDFFAWSNNFKLFFTTWSLYETYVLQKTPFMLKFIEENQKLYKYIVSRISEYQNDRTIKNEIEELLYKAYLIIKNYPNSPSNYDICK